MDHDFKTATVGWIEQRAFLQNALAALPPSSDLAREVAQAFDEIDGPQAKRPFDGESLVDVPLDSVLRCGGYNVRALLRHVWGPSAKGAGGGQGVGGG